MKKRLLSFVIILTLVLGMTVTSESFAASVSARLSGGSCQVGKTVTVTLTYSGPQLFGATATLSYDTSALELTGTGGNITTPNGNSFLIETMGATSMSATFTFKAKKAGSYTVSASTTNGLTYDSEEFSCAPVSATVKVTEPPEPAKPSKPSTGTSSGSGTNTNSGTPNRRGDFTEEEKIEPEEEEEEKPLEKPEQIEVEIGGKDYVIFEDLKKEDAPEGFKLATAKYGQWEWEVPVYAEEDGTYILICVVNKETEAKEFFLYSEEDEGSFSSEIPVSVAEFMEYKELAEAAKAGERNDDSILLPVMIGVLIAAAACAIVLQIIILRKRRDTVE